MTHNLSATISVSQMARENYLVRSTADPEYSYVIPNAVIADKFTPDPSKIDPKGTINIVIVGRQSYVKGIDLLLDIIPEICKRHKDVHFIWGGDGDMTVLVKEMIDTYRLQD